MINEMPPDPFGAPEELVAVMKGLSQIHSAALTAGLSEKVATDFISNVFVQLVSVMQNVSPAP